jgi:hypothetical protein
VRALAPQLLARHGIGPICAATLLVADAYRSIPLRPSSVS